MTKIKALQILVYITFGLFILQNGVRDAYRGFKDGYEDGAYAARHANKQRGPLIMNTFNGDLLTHNSHGNFKVDNSYTLQNVTINAEIRLNPGADTTPLWLDAIYATFVFGVLVVLIIMAITINKVIVKIANGTMFDEQCIKLIRRTASLLLTYSIADYIYQRLSYYKDSRLVHAPFLSVADTASFNFQILLCAIMVFIIAETFKQAARIKQEQDLTI
jgi:hypothetical protein